jgi:hypothetical protein
MDASLLEHLAMEECHGAAAFARTARPLLASKQRVAARFRFDDFQISDDAGLQLLEPRPGIGFFLIKIQWQAPIP